MPLWIDPLPSSSLSCILLLRCVAALVHMYFNSDILAEDTPFVPEGAKDPPPVGSFEKLQDYVQVLPAFDIPEAFGLHSNAQVTLMKVWCRALCLRLRTHPVPTSCFPAPISATTHPRPIPPLQAHPPPPPHHEDPPGGYYQSGNSGVHRGGSPGGGLLLSDGQVAPRCSARLPYCLHRKIWGPGGGGFNLGRGFEGVGLTEGVYPIGDIVVVGGGVCLWVATAQTTGGKSNCTVTHFNAK